MEERCPQIAAAYRKSEEEVGSASGQPVLDCLAAMQPITLNGQPLQGLRYHHYTHPETGIRGRVAYIPTDSLPEGENRLVVAAIPRPEQGRDPDDAPLPPHHITFWVGR